MRRRASFWWAVLAPATAILVMTSVSAYAAVWTDQADYPPGSEVTINGDGMAGGETVGVWVYLPDGSLAQYHEVPANDAGNFTDTYLLPPPDAPVVGTYGVVAFGLTSEATYSATFDDHTPTPTDLTATTISSGEIDLAWTGVAIGSGANANHEYHVERCTGTSSECAGSQTGTAGAVGTNSWTSAASATGASDNACATTTATSGVVGFWKSFGLAIPAGASIGGIEVAVKESKGATGGPITIKVNVGADESTLGTEKTGGSLSNALCTDAGNDTDTFGTPSDTWGRTWTAAEINSSNFTVRLTTNAAVINRVDSIAVTVYWNQFSEIAALGTASGTPNTFEDTTVDCETTYSYRVRIHDHDTSLFGSYSNVDTATTDDCPVSTFLVSGSKFQDLLPLGTKDGDPGLEGWTLNAYADDGDGSLDATEGAASPVATTTTDSNGDYSLTLNAGGDYVVCEQAEEPAALDGSWYQSFPTGNSKCDNATDQAPAGHSFSDLGADQTDVDFGNWELIFAGFYSPVGAENNAKAGQGVPFKWNAYYNDATLENEITSTTGWTVASSRFTVGCTYYGDDDSVPSADDAGQSGLRYDWFLVPTATQNGQFVFVWNTLKGWAKTCRTFNVLYNGQIVGSADFFFTK